MTETAHGLSGNPNLCVLCARLLDGMDESLTAPAAVSEEPATREAAATRADAGSPHPAGTPK